MTARITYNSVNIDFALSHPDGFVRRPKQESNTNETGGGKIETINLFGRDEIVVNAFFSRAVYHSLLAWWSWARQGKTFSVAADSGDVGNTTLDGAAAAAQKTIPLTATAAFASGDYCLIRAADDDEFEVVQIDTISAGVSVTAETNLIYTYASGDTFRHLDYYPSCLLAPGVRDFEPSRTGVRSTTSDHYYRFQFKFVEAL